MNLLRKLKLRRVDLVDQGANPGAFVTLFKRAGEPGEDNTVDKETAETLQAENEELKKANADLEAKVAALTPPDPEPDPVAKADPEVRKALEDLQKQAAAAEAKVAKMEADAERTAYIAKAAEFAPTFGQADDLGPVLLKIAKAVTEDEYTALTEKFRSAIALAKDSAHFKELGVDGGAEPADAEAKLQKMAEERVAKLEGKETFAQAYDAVTKTPEGRALYTAYLNEKAPAVNTGTPKEG